MKKLLFILSAIILFSCGRSIEKGDLSNFKSTEDLEVVDEFMEFVPPPTNQPPQQSQAEVSQKLIKTGHISFESKDVKKDYKAITSQLDRYKAYIEHENESRTQYRISYDMTLRVVAEKYDSLFNTIVQLAGKIESKSSRIEDVTERYYDLKTRIKNKQALEKRYVELLSKASEIKDILEIEKNLNEVRTDIERLQGQFKYLSKQISLSTINVNFYEQLPYTYDTSNRKGFGARLLTALSNGWQNLLSFTVGLINFWPFLFLIVGVVWLFRKWRKLRKGKNS